MIDPEVKRLLRFIACAVAGVVFMIGALSYARSGEERAVIRRHEHRKAFEAVEGFNFDGLRASNRLHCSDRAVADLVTCTGVIYDVTGHTKELAYVCHVDGCAWVVQP